MTDVTFLSYNVKGLNSVSKRLKVLAEIEQYRADIVFIQESHLSVASNVKLYSPFYPTWYYGDSISKRARGVAIGFARGTGFTLEERLTDPEGRFLFLKGKFGNTVYTLANIYAPNANPMQYLSKILGKLKNFAEGYTILMGDLNFAMNPREDSTARAKETTNVQLHKIKQKIHDSQLVDVWRIFHPNIYDYTFFSPPHGTYTRIDYILADHRLLDLITETKIGIMTVSDHAPITMKIKLSVQKNQQQVWRLNDSLIRDEERASRMEVELKQFFQINDTEEISSATLWETHKAYIRGILIAESAREKKERQRKANTLIKEIGTLEREHKDQRLKETYHKLILKRDALKEIMELEAKNKLNCIARERYLWGNKPNKQLAKMAQKKKTRNYIEKIKRKDGKLVYTTREIADTFKEYYEELYTIKQAGWQAGEKEAKTRDFLEKAGLPRLEELESLSMDRPISEEEIKRALKNTMSGKSPGPDGFSVFYYKRFSNTLIPKMCEYFNDLGSKFETSSEAIAASVTLILKEGKDSSLCSGYRPISLLNTDIKLFAKILAERLKGVMQFLVHPDQVGFVPNREGKDNSIRAILLLQNIRQNAPPGLFLSVDAEKAFDRVDWGLMKETLTAMGIGNRMSRWINTLYHQPSAKIKINGNLSTSFEMKNGTRQGCPLSPLLFILSLEPLLATVRKDPEINGVRVKEEEHKLSALADDILFFVTNPLKSIPKLCETLQQYGDISNFKINVTKSEILNINLNKSEVSRVKEICTFPWSKELKYLGIKLANTIQRIYKINYVPLLNEIKNELKRTVNKPISWIGRINMLKMVVVPKILYKFLLIPIALPHQFLRILNSLLINYVWKKKKHRISLSILKQGKSLGGLAVPDIKSYYKAAVLSRAVEWARDRKDKRWVQIENAQVSTQLSNLIWIPAQYRALNHKVYDITRDTLRMWDRIQIFLDGEFNSPLMNLKENAYFAPGEKKIGGNWIRKDTVHLGDIIKDGEIMTYEELKSRLDFWNLDGWHYSQLSHFVRHLPRPLRTVEELTPLEKICKSKNSKGTISKLYGILVKIGARGEAPFVEKWERELGITRGTNTFQRIMQLTHSSAIDTRTAEANYKCISGWYVTPDKVNKYNAEQSAECWRGCPDRGTMAHLWWTCPKIQIYWDIILRQIKEITGKEIKKDPWEVLFHGSKEGIKKYKLSLIPHLLNAAKKLIPKKWQEIESPHVWNWIDAVEETYRLEELKDSLAETSSDFKSKWDKWKEYKKTWSYVEKLRGP